MDREIKQIFCVMSALKDAGETGLTYSAIKARAEEISLSTFHEALPSACNGTTPINRLLRDAQRDEEVTFIRGEGDVDTGYKIQPLGVRNLTYVTNIVVDPYLQKEHNASEAIGVITVPTVKGVPQTLGL